MTVNNQLHDKRFNLFEFFLYYADPKRFFSLPLKKYIVKSVIVVFFLSFLFKSCIISQFDHISLRNYFFDNIFQPYAA